MEFVTQTLQQIKLYKNGTRMVTSNMSLDLVV